MNAAAPALRRPVRWALAIAAGIAMRFGYGLEPLWWLALLAPVPLLVAAQHASAREAAALALVAALIGPVLPWSYLAGLMPTAVVVGIAAAMALQWAAVIVVTRALHQRGPGWCTPFVFGITLAAFDALLAAASPDGTAASLAYTQADALPLVQVAGLGGTPAITFVMGVVALALAAAVDPGSGLRFNRAPLVATVLLLVATFTFGAWRLARPAGGATLPVAAVAIDARIADRRSNPAAFERLLADYEGAVSRAAASQPRLVLLPERIGDIASTDVDAVAQRLAAAARSAKADLVVGFGVFGPEGNHNEAWWIDAASGTLVRYRKQHLVQGLEARFAKGPATTVKRTIDGHTLALAICKDMDFPATIRRSALPDVAAMVVPAWDFGADGWLHSRMAMLRGIENGVGLLRAAREGQVTISDAQGRVRAQTASGAAAAVLTGTLPVQRVDTLFTQFGAGVSWLWPALLLILLLVARRSSR